MVPDETWSMFSVVFHMYAYYISGSGHEIVSSSVSASSAAISDRGPFTLVAQRSQSVYTNQDWSFAQKLLGVPKPCSHRSRRRST